MSQNTSSAVMQQRREPADSFDYFPTPLWATRALTMMLDKHKLIDGEVIVIDPCCGQGHMTRPLREEFEHVHAYDIQDMGFGEVADYLWPDGDYVTDWTIANPPFRLAQQFILKALVNSRDGVAMFVRTSFLEGIRRHNELFSEHPPYIIFQFTERVPLFKGRVDPRGSSATSYCWIVWKNTIENTSTKFDWIPPCRKRLEREGDYA